jgi:hypothetical protein
MTKLGNVPKRARRPVAPMLGDSPSEGGSAKVQPGGRVTSPSNVQDSAHYAVATSAITATSEGATSFASRLGQSNRCRGEDAPLRPSRSEPGRRRPSGPGSSCFRRRGSAVIHDGVRPLAFICTSRRCSVMWRTRCGGPGLIPFTAFGESGRLAVLGDQGSACSVNWRRTVGWQCCGTISQGFWLASPTSVCSRRRAWRS